MNPLDKEELKAFLKIIKNDMPLHTEITTKIKHLFSQGMPKNLMDYSVKIDNKFLNDNLHTIEEMEYRKKGITNDFKNYQHKYYDEYGILNHDLYFEHEGTIYPKLAGGSFFSQSFLSTSSASLNRTSSSTNGADLTTEASNASGNNIAGYIYAFHLSTGVIGHLYDRVAFRRELGTASGQLRYGSYDSQSSVPTNKMCDTGLFNSPANSSYVLQSVTEYALTTTENWTAILGDATGTTAPYFYYKFPVATSNNAYDLTNATTFVNPANAAWDATNYVLAFESKLVHS